MEIHEKIKQFLAGKNVSAGALGKEYNASQQTISNYLNGTNAMPLAFLIFIYEKYQNEIDLAALFAKKETSIIAEPSAPYGKRASKEIILEKIGKILDEELTN